MKELAEQTLQRKVFVMYWEELMGPYSSVHSNILLLSEDWFTEENGFKPDEIKAINEMKVDEVHKFPTYYLYKVYRVK